ncbi:protein of unknown function (plasmid) [Streptantibioticus cattleyicolor NRRL 8057 = DSM 46488]|nr:protein of unknown function [Streptantibioticus cattleyicolor NRRL 8057 = DSM 46488]
MWLRDLADLYRFVTRDLGGLGVAEAETVVVGRPVKRPGAVHTPGVRAPGRRYTPQVTSAHTP